MTMQANESAQNTVVIYKIHKHFILMNVEYLKNVINSFNPSTFN